MLIVPVGIDIGHYWHCRTTLLTIFGEPISMLPYLDQYNQNPAHTLNILRNKLAEEMKKHMIHIETEEYYDTFHNLRQVYNSRMKQKLGITTKRLLDSFVADKKMIACLDACLKEDEAKIEELQKN
ncbi:MAG: hypothetical protein HC896_08515 [Bacteroidales bacterium]|nr:hypothetical protein [Bacteroidales bacterium]